MADMDRALAMLKRLPPHLPPPTSVAAEPDGMIAFEWFHDPRHLVSVSIDDKGIFHYAALLFPNKHWGAETKLDIGCLLIERLVKENQRFT